MTGTPNAYITEFQGLAVMVTHISKAKLIMLFTKGLPEPLRGWVKDFKLVTLPDAITRTQDMEDVAPKNRYLSKPFIPQKGKDKKPFQKGGPGNNRLDERTWNEL